MPRRQKRFNCFYCGCRSAKTFPLGTCDWKCEKCEAVNYLDENGEITDPPTSASQNYIRFAEPQLRSESPARLEIKKDPESPFCPRCLQNQIFIKDILADYTPPDDGDWQEKYKIYVQELENRYPPVCEGCEARIRTQMRRSDYFVSADNLGRSLKRDHSKGSWIYRRGWGYTSLALLLTLGKLMWFTSWIGQFLWHAMCFTSAKQNLEYPWVATTQQSKNSCVSQVFHRRPLCKTCLEGFNDLARWALILGLLSIWWNPTFVNKLKLLHGRSTGKREYYTLQVIFLLVRWVMFVPLTHVEVFPGIDAQLWKGMHAFMLPLNLLSALVPYRVIKWDSSPRIAHTYSPGSLLAQKPQESRSMTTPNQSEFTAQNRRNFGGSRSNEQIQRFPIDRLGPDRQQLFSTPISPPTPPPDEEDDNMMDWEPTKRQYDLRSATSYRDPQQQHSKTSGSEPSPFYGHLPQSVVSPARALRNPPYQPPPMERASAQQHNFFSRNTPKPSKAFAGLTNDDSPSPSPASTKFVNDLSPMKFANPRFFPKNTVQDTGLEDFFAKATLGKSQPSNLITSSGATQEYHENQRTNLPDGRGMYTYGMKTSDAPRRSEANTQSGYLSFGVLLLIAAVVIVALGLVLQRAYFGDQSVEMLSGFRGYVFCRLGRECGLDGHGALDDG